MADHGGEDLSGATAVLLIGNNDFLTLADGADPFAVIAAAVGATVAAAADLAAAGVGEAVVSFAPRGGLLPPVAGPQPRGRGARRLRLGALRLEPRLGGGRPRRDRGRGPASRPRPAHRRHRRGPRLVRDPRAAGPRLLSSGDPALAADDADQVAFWDDVHPSQAIHGVIAAFNAYALVADPTALSAGDDALGASAAASLVLASGGDDAGGCSARATTPPSAARATTSPGGKGGDLLLGRGSGSDAIEGGTRARRARWRRRRRPAVGGGKGPTR